MDGNENQNFFCKRKEKKKTSGEVKRTRDNDKNFK